MLIFIPFELFVLEFEVSFRTVGIHAYLHIHWRKSTTRWFYIIWIGKSYSLFSLRKCYRKKLLNYSLYYQHDRWKNNSQRISKTMYCLELDNAKCAFKSPFRLLSRKNHHLDIAEFNRSNISVPIQNFVDEKVTIYTQSYITTVCELIYKMSCTYDGPFE